VSDGLPRPPPLIVYSGSTTARGGAPPVTGQEKSKQEQIDEIEKIEMCGDVVF
jgi:hypothetical protein